MDKDIEQQNEFTSNRLNMIGGYCNNGEFNNRFCDYVIVYPVGYMEFFTKEGLDNKIKSLEDFIATGEDKFGDAEDELVTYNELKDLQHNNVWTIISGPANSHNDDLSYTIGIKYI